MKHYTKPSVTKGEWTTRAQCGVDGKDISIKVQILDDTYQDHYAIYINGKRQRKTYFGEMAHHDVARAYNDLVGWQNSVFGDEL
jgi:hypothetical protein